MNETQRMLLQRIYESSFAMDDLILYLDTHPDDVEALSYYQYVVGMRDGSMEAYENQFGPLMADAVTDHTRWTWLTETWPWEGEM